MTEFPIENLPTDLQGFVVQRVARNGCQDLFTLRFTSKSMRSLSYDAEVYASFDMLSIPWRMGMFKLPPLLRRCYQEGNPSTLYIKGVEYFYRQDRQVEGLSLIKRAADAGYQPASYTYTMTTKIWGGDGDLLCGFTRKTIADIGKVVRNSDGIWNIDHREDFGIKRHVFESTMLPTFYSCPCTPVLDWAWALYHIENSKAEDMCNRCFWIKEVALFLRDFKPSTGHPDFAYWQ
ncbi:putative F-box protein [Raphanus sativus]|nr:putative F-box protein [Raphanus sativus]